MAAQALILPIHRTTPSGQTVCSFGLATNRTWTDNNGQRQQQVEFHSLVAWGKTAENISQYMRKGSVLMVEGRLQTHSWDGQDGQKYYRPEIVIETCQFGPKPQGDVRYERDPDAEIDVQARGDARTPDRVAQERGEINTPPHARRNAGPKFGLDEPRRALKRRRLSHSPRTTRRLT